jgi:transcriptional regulator NrdR family protein
MVHVKKELLKKAGKKGKKTKKGSIIVKRAGKPEVFDERKIYASAYAACMSAHLAEQKCEAIAEKVSSHVKTKLKGKKGIASSHLSIWINDSLKKHNKDAAFLYRTHLDLS